MKKIINLGLWMALMSPLGAFADNHADHAKNAKCSCSQECKENCKTKKDKDCKCDGKSCECKDGKPCH